MYVMYENFLFVSLGLVVGLVGLVWGGWIFLLFLNIQGKDSNAGQLKLKNWLKAKTGR